MIPAAKQIDVNERFKDECIYPILFSWCIDYEYNVPYPLFSVKYTSMKDLLG
ncbi:MAG: hypothetical protein P8Y70_00210 [Candidatus Lokiarchaeota archaeon]